MSTNEINNVKPESNNNAPTKENVPAQSAPAPVPPKAPVQPAPASVPPKASVQPAATPVPPKAPVQPAPVPVPPKVPVHPVRASVPPKVPVQQQPVTPAVASTQPQNQSSNNNQNNANTEAVEQTKIQSQASAQPQAQNNTNIVAASSEVNNANGSNDDVDNVIDTAASCKNGNTSSTVSSGLPNLLDKIIYWIKWWRYTFIHHFKTVLYILCTVVPALLVLIYTLFFYSPMYITEAIFAIKSNNVEQVPIISAQSLLGGASNKDIYVACAYIQSPDMFYKINERLGLIAHYSDYDFFSSLAKNPTEREITEYWKSMVSVNINNDSELMMVSVKAYTPEMSRDIENEILKELDVLVNTMNQKAHDDAIKLATDEVTSAQALVEKDAEKLRLFRNEHILLDPTSEASNIMNLVSKLEGQLAEVQTELNMKSAYLREDSIEHKVLLNKKAAIEKQLEQTRNRIAGDIQNKQRLSDTMGEYEKLIMKSEFSKKLLSSAMTSLETARQISLSKSRYLVIIKQPLLPDESLWPKPFLSAFLTLLITTFGFGIISLIISAIREHAGI